MIYIMDNLKYSNGFFKLSIEGARICYIVAQFCCFSAQICKKYQIKKRLCYIDVYEKDDVRVKSPLIIKDMKWRIV